MIVGYGDIWGLGMIVGYGEIWGLGKSKGDGKIVDKERLGRLQKKNAFRLGDWEWKERH